MLMCCGRPDLSIFDHFKLYFQQRALHLSSRPADFGPETRMPRSFEGSVAPLEI